MKKGWLFIVILVVLIASSGFLLLQEEEEKDSKNLNLFSSVFKILKHDFVDTLDSDILIRRAIDGMVKSVDPHTVFFDEKESIERAKVWQGSTFSGIGSRIIYKDSAVVIAGPIEGYGAQLNDVRAGDIIVEVDSQSVKGKTLDETIKLLRGEPETLVSITVDRPYVGLVKKKIIRKQVHTSSIGYATLLDSASGVGYIQVQQFLAYSDKEFLEALNKLKENPNLKSIILDFRDNIGGLVEQAVNCANAFLPKNTVVIHLHGKSTDYNNLTLNEPIDTLMPLVILTNSNTISAGEIFTGAMQDLDRAVIMGQKTFGKGLVQGTRFPGYGTCLYLTAARYYTPSSRCIQKRDYSHRYADGKEEIYADTLKKIFYTKNGRKVFDIGGIAPDIKTESNQKSSPILDALNAAGLIFDYATYFRNTKKTTVSADKMVVTDVGFYDFLRFVEKRNYVFKIPEEEKLKEFNELAKKDSVFDFFEKKYNALYKELIKHKKEMLVKNKEQIKKALQNEIVVRYYYSTGLYLNTIPLDVEIQQAKALLVDMKKYNEVLHEK